MTLQDKDVLLNFQQAHRHHYNLFEKKDKRPTSRYMAQFKYLYDLNMFHPLGKPTPCWIQEQFVGRSMAKTEVTVGSSDS